ncbi:Golgi resident protein GCP60-like [Artemia franciscana]|uniref:Golgi resident protein GCP60-like n=1 Tax=Artemia franciscana TaxID=6661 RepID=UPI0032DA3022
MEDLIQENWGIQLVALYKLATKFYREKEGKAIQLTYQEKCQLSAYAQQAVNGKYIPEKHGVAGVLDVVGRDRQAAWQILGDMTSEVAMNSFVELLNARCSLFRPFIDAYVADQKEKERQRLEEEEKLKQEEEMRLLEEQRQKEEEAETSRQDAKKQQIQEVLNKQTYAQFKAYAEQQYPNDPEQQNILIKQLQEHHYHQYMSQLLRQNTPINQAPLPSLDAEQPIEGSLNGDTPSVDGEREGQEENLSETSPLPVDGIPVKEILPASMWTRKDIKEFKDSIRREEKEMIIKVGHGEIVTVRVPTQEEGSCLYWEFATDSYDIGFGVLFEWTPPTEDSNVSVHISDIEDEESDPDEAVDTQDIESGGKVRLTKDQAPMSVIVPIYRRDCHEEVYAGSHAYPSQGVYLLKFDNSYSLWRSKTLYYRVYYTK